MWRALKSLMSKLPYPIFLRAFWSWYFLRDVRRWKAARQRGGVALLQDLDLATVKKSEALFILGSGPSINRISAERWAAIARHDTVGFNFWLCHAFVPRLYFFEAIPRSDSDIYRAYCEVAKSRAAEYRAVPKVVTEMQHSGAAFLQDLPPEWRENLYTPRPVTLAARDEAEFAYGLRELQRRGLFQAATRIRSLFKYAGSLSSLVALAARLRYRTVVLCGVDLATQEYFYQDPELYPATSDLVPSPRSLPHLIFRELPWLVKIDAVLRQMRRQLLEPAGIEVFVENRGSALWPEIPEAPAALFGVSSVDPKVTAAGDTRNKPVVK